MKKGMFLAVAVFMVGASVAVHADGTFPVSGCRLLDTRPGDPLAANTALNVDVRGECGIPESATAVIFNLTVISPSAMGYGQVYGTSTAPDTAVITFNSGETVVTTAALVKLSADDPGTSAWDPPSWGVKVKLNQSADVVLDVTGYTAQPTATTTFQGAVSHSYADEDVAIVWLFDNQVLPLVCMRPYIDPDDCGVQAINEEVCGTAHIEQYAGDPHPAGPHLIVDSLEDCP